MHVMDFCEWPVCSIWFEMKEFWCRTVLQQFECVCTHHECRTFVQEVWKRFDKASLHYDQVSWIGVYL